MARTKRSKLDQDIMMLSKEDAMIIHQACRILEQQSGLQRAAAQGDISAGYPSHLENEHALEEWNRTHGLQNPSWDAGLSLTPLSFIPTPPRTSYDPQNSAGIGPSSLSISGPTVLPDAYSDFNFDNPTDFGLQDQAHEGIPAEPLNMALMTALNNDNLNRHSSCYPEDRQNTSDSGSDKNDSGRQHRKRFTAKEREETGITRELVACIRCRQQRIRVGGHIFQQLLTNLPISVTLIMTTRMGPAKPA
jgi:hypothetical protein